ncbi:MAG TPA: hypothetical protein VFR85_14395 [Anaeromyxobacteraceae bacterium]|nr:hypothetical protein [Anaeromyxobacteraceae bacterium]
MRRLLGPAVLLALAACGGCDDVPAAAVTNCQTVGIASAKTDILFVVDDSGSMQEEQQNLAANFDAFIAQLAALPVANDYHIGITTTSVENFDGTIVFPAANVPGSSPARPCPNIGRPYPQGALVAVDPASIATYPTDGVFVDNRPKVLVSGSPTLVQDFQTNVKVGICGSGKEEGLEAARLALSDRVADGTNAGFLRPGARLVVIVVSDEDDCTGPAADNDACHNTKGPLVPVQDFVDFFAAPVDGEVRSVLVAAIAGVDPVTHLPQVCGTAFDKADRYAAFVSAFGAVGLIDSICNSSFRDTLIAIATLIGQEVPLAQEPADWRLLTVAVVKPGGGRVACTLGTAGGSTDVVYAPATPTKSATLTFGGACTLSAGDQIDLKILCAG